MFTRFEDWEDKGETPLLWDIFLFPAFGIEGSEGREEARASRFEMFCGDLVESASFVIPERVDRGSDEPRVDGASRQIGACLDMKNSVHVQARRLDLRGGVTRMVEKWDASNFVDLHFGGSVW